ncbi:MAG TPA: alpha/beta fold hydrolase [Dermatophilaceae bacterium]|nr:alpha/beta fold hydrolase [Dermatophilaceae bacterium]
MSPRPHLMRAGAIAHRRSTLARARIVPLLLLVLLGVGMVVAGCAGPSQPTQTQVAEQSLTVPVRPEPDGTPVGLDVTVLRPLASGRYPSVVLAHGFGGSKADLLPRGRDLAARGYVVLAYTARGFGASGGRIHLSAPDYEVADAADLLNLLATREDVLRDGPGDPRVGVAGASYGGALALMLAGSDSRVDAVVSGITWNDLAKALFPQSVASLAGGTPAALQDPGSPGPLLRRWVSSFFAASVLPALTAGRSAGAAAASATRAGTVSPDCGRFDPTVCRLMLQAATTGRPSTSALSMLRAHSPQATASRIAAPTLLVQGLRDSLFGLAEADATARAITAGPARPPVAVQWFEGGHDGGPTPPEESLLWPWLDRYLIGDTATVRRPGSTPPLPVAGFAAAVPSGRRSVPDQVFTASGYPGIAGVPTGATTVRLRPAEPTAAPGGQAILVSPPGGEPAALTALPAGPTADALTALGNVAYRLAALPGQSVAFDTEPAPVAVTAFGAPRVRLTVASSTTDATLFLSLWRLNAGGAASTRPLVAPVRLVTSPGAPVTVTLALPAGTFAVEEGSRWRVMVSATQTGYAVPTDARRYQVSLAGDSALVFPTAPTASASASNGPDGELVTIVVVLAALAIGVPGGWTLARWRRRRTDRRRTRADLADVPLVVDGLVKTYRDGHRAVDDVSWTAERGQVVGLLGPNGAGKTTTMRMIMGLIRPERGEIHVLGEPVHADSPVLARVGALIEGPGFLPHLTGRQNLAAYWAATGRDPAEAHVKEALRVAALSDALDRPVRAYSHGMRQRLGIAQAMLGRPEVLILDEPTNGLDPPQIAAMRPILRDYAAGGRTVIVSSHLLAEVEATCSHVVVMNRGRVVLTGPVPELVERSDVTVVGLTAGSDATAVVESLRTRLGPAGSVELDEDAGQPRLTIHSRAPRDQLVALIVAAGGRVEWVRGRRQLEEVFLGVIADTDEGADSGDDSGDPGDPDSSPPGSGTDGDAPTDASQQRRSRLDRLREVRPR